MITDKLSDTVNENPDCRVYLAHLPIYATKTRQMSENFPPCLLLTRHCAVTVRDPPLMDNQPLYNLTRAHIL